MFFIKLRWSSLGLIHMSAWTNFQLWSWVSNEKPKQTMEEWQSVAEFYTNYSNASIYLFNQFGELKWQFSSFLDPPQWPHTWFPLRVSISYCLNHEYMSHRSGDLFAFVWITIGTPVDVSGRFEKIFSVFFFSKFKKLLILGAFYTQLVKAKF